MIRALRRLWRSRDWMLIPLGALALCVCAFLAFAWMGLDLPFDGREPFDPPRYETTWRVEPGNPDAPPPRGMTVSRAGFGTVTTAPAALAEEAPHETPLGRWDLPIVQPEVARFIRAFPTRRWLNPPEDGMVTCTLEAPPVFRGRLVLRGGCVLFDHADAAEPDAIALLSGGNLFRDPEGYLAFGLREGFAEYRLRVGEEDRYFEGAGCSRPVYLPAPPELARICGAERMINIATAKRVPACSQATLERIEAEVHEMAELNARLSREHAVCRAANGPHAPCPPSIAPAPPSLLAPSCRIPDETRERLARSLQSSQGSSTQP